MEIFQKYGKILGIDVNGNGFAFVQFGSVAEAQAAVAGENGKKFREKNIGNYFKLNVLFLFQMFDSKKIFFFIYRG